MKQEVKREDEEEDEQKYKQKVEEEKVKKGIAGSGKISQVVKKKWKE